jgi:hypothetical protein
LEIKGLLNAQGRGFLIKALRKYVPLQRTVRPQISFSIGPYLVVTSQEALRIGELWHYDGEKEILKKWDLKQGATH